MRDDSGVVAGSVISVYYDPMISKLCAWAADRPAAIERMRRALDEYHVGGIKTNLAFHRRVMRHPAFLAGDYDTGFIERHKAELAPPAPRAAVLETPPWRPPCTPAGPGQPAAASAPTEGVRLAPRHCCADGGISTMTEPPVPTDATPDARRPAPSPRQAPRVRRRRPRRARARTRARLLRRR